MKHGKSKFTEYAAHAASLEKAGYYRDAEFAWQVAAQHARKPANREWANSRERFCSAWASRYGSKKEAA